MKGGTRLHGFSTENGASPLPDNGAPESTREENMDTMTRKSPEIEKVLIHKATIIRCPVCHSANVRIGAKTPWGIPVFCLECERMFPTRRA